MLSPGQFTRRSSRGLATRQAVPASCRPGMRADFVVYSDSVLAGGEHMPQVLHTYLDGDLVWSLDTSV